MKEEKIGTAKKKANVIRIEDNAKSSKNILINIEENSWNIIIVTNTESRNIVVDCKKNSKTKYVELNNSNKSNSIDISRKIVLGKDSELDFYTIYSGKENQNSSTTAELGENAYAKMKNIVLAEKQEHNHDIKIIHKGRNSKSDLQSRGLLSESKMKVKGMIKIEENAGESEGYQKSDVLIIKDSEAISVPELEIHNNDVKCSHGSSITRLDSEKIFYLQTRGLSEKDAKILLAKAFLGELIEELEQDEMEELNIIIETKLLSMTK